MMRSNTVTLAILFAILAVPLRGEVIESTAAGFLVRHTAAINAPPAKVYTALTDGVGRWWDPAHTLSHDARNLSLDAKPGGCFCERLPDEMDLVLPHSDQGVDMYRAARPSQLTSRAATINTTGATRNAIGSAGHTCCRTDFRIGARANIPH